MKKRMINKKDQIYLSVLCSWAEDSETIIAYDCNEVEKVYSFVTVERDYPSNTNVYVGQSWQMIYEKYFKEAVLEYLNEGDNYEYFNEVEKELILND